MGPSVPNHGRLAYEPADYVPIPKSITFAIRPHPGPSRMLVVESRAPLAFTEHKQFGRHMPVDPTVLVLPEPRIKHGGAHSSIFYRDNPLKSVGWKGDPFPYKPHIRDIIPISSDRIHVAPSAWRMFEAAGFVVITFVPRIAVADPNAEEPPSYHRNVDNDESVFAHHDAGGVSGEAQARGTGGRCAG
jgi:homogentisate 1,2-dioxygenase